MVYTVIMARPENSTVLAGESPVRVRADSPGSRLRLWDEIPTAKRSVGSPYQAESKGTGRNIK